VLRLRNFLFTLVLAAAAPVAAEASLIFDLVDQLDGTVSLNYSGFVNTTGLTLDSPGVSNTANLISPNQGRIRRAGLVDVYDTNSTAISQPFGSGGQAIATSGSGSAVRVNFSDPTALGLPAGYVSLAAISGSMNFAGSLASLGLTAGTYSFNWGIGGLGRTVELNISSVTPVPEPATLGLFAIGSVVSGYGYRRRMKKAKMMSAEA
jgi:hypothetical protein